MKDEQGNEAALHGFPDFSDRNSVLAFIETLPDTEMEKAEEESLKAAMPKQSATAKSELVIDEEGDAGEDNKNDDLDSKDDPDEEGKEKLFSFKADGKVFKGKTAQEASDKWQDYMDKKSRDINSNLTKRQQDIAKAEKALKAQVDKEEAKKLEIDLDIEELKDILDDPQATATQITKARKGLAALYQKQKLLEAKLEEMSEEFDKEKQYAEQNRKVDALVIAHIKQRKEQGITLTREEARDELEEIAEAVAEIRSNPEKGLAKLMKIKNKTTVQPEKGDDKPDEKNRRTSSLGAGVSPKGIQGTRDAAEKLEKIYADGSARNMDPMELLKISLAAHGYRVRQK